MGRAPCCAKVGLHRGPWTPTEDSLLTNFILTHGEGQWRSLPKKAGLLRCGKSCRLRWMNYLRPDIKRGNISIDEEDLIIRLHTLLGNRWSLIAGRLPGRTDNEIKNYWNTHLSKKLRSQGTDPNTHKRLSDLNPTPPKPRPKKKRQPTNNKQTKDKAWFERPKVHQPKPIRVTSLLSSSLTRNASNASFESNLTTVSNSPSNGPTHGLGFLIGGEDEDNHEDQTMLLDKLYEEYFQLIKADDNHDDLDLDLHSNGNDEARDLDSFAESLLI